MKEDAYYAYYAPERRAWVIVSRYHPDMIDRTPGTIPPESACIIINTEALIPLLQAVAETDLISPVLSKKLYDRDMANRHLDIIESLIQKVG